MDKYLGENGFRYVMQKIKMWLSNKVDKVDGKSLISDVEIARLASVYNYDDTAVKQDIANLEANAYDDTQLREEIVEKYYNKTQVDAKLVAGVRYKGSVDSYSALPTSDNVVGDMYNIVLASEHNKANENVVWNGTTWDNQGGTVDLSGYIQSSDLSAITNTEIDEITA